MEDRFNINDVRALRTKEGTVFEVLTLVTLLITWIFAILNQHLSEYGNIIGLIIFTAISLVLLYEVYWPGQIKFTGITLRNTRQVAYAVRWCRVLALQIAVLNLGLSIIGFESPLSKSWSIGMVVFIGVMGFVFIYLIQKNSRE